MKTRIMLILFMTLALCSCLGGHSDSNNSIDIRTKSPYQDASFVLSQMCMWDNLVFEDGEWRVVEMTKQAVNESWFDKKAYDEAKSLAKSHNKTLKKMLSKLEEDFGIDDYVLHSAVFQKEYVNLYNEPGGGSWKGFEMNTYDTSFAQKSFEVEEGVTRQAFIFYDQGFLTDLEKNPVEPNSVRTINDVPECLHLIAVQFAEETHVYVTFMSGSIYAALPGSKEEVNVIYMTSYPKGGRIMW